MSQDDPNPVHVEPDGSCGLMADRVETRDTRECARRDCLFERLGKREHSAFCSDACRQWAYRHPEDDLRQYRHECIRRRKDGPDPYAEEYKPQTRKVLAMLKTGPQTTGDFLRAGIGRFGARIGELRAAGHDVRTRKLTDHAAEYRLYVGE